MLATDHDVGDDTEDSIEEAIDIVASSTTYQLIIVQHVLSTQVERADKHQRHNLFQMFLIIKDCHVRTIIDGGSTNNLVSSDLPKTLG